MPTQPSKNLDTFPNPHPDRDYIIEIECPEFTCLCPKTGQPDFASLTLEYAPDRLCVELKSLNVYIWSYSNEGHFHEDVTNRILNDLVAVTHPRYLRLRAKFNVRGGLYTTVEVVHRQSGWNSPPPPPADLPREIQELPERETPAATPAKASAAPVTPASKTRNPVPLTEPDAPLATPPKPRHPVPLTEPAAPVTPAPKPRHPVPLAEPDAPVATPSSTGNGSRMLRRPRRSDPPPPAEAAPPAETIIEPPLPEPVVRQDGLYIGIDFGTTGCRAIAVDINGTLKAEMSAPIAAPARHNDQETQDPTV